jgi:glycosyltransferase involved in cell wall biosynthesis
MEVRAVTATQAAPLSAIGLVVPVRDEEGSLGPALASLVAAMGQPELRDVPVHLAVVLDGCVDRSGDVARTVAANAATNATSNGRRHRITIVESSAGRVGMARRIGFDEVLAPLAPTGLGGVWLATTDADSRVPRSWLVRQIQLRTLGVTAWAGTVAVGDWADRPPSLQTRFRHHYRITPPEGGHIHGASMGFSAGAYMQAGGFPPLATGEDHALWRRLGDVGARKMYDPTCPVITSARRKARAPLGFASALDLLEGGSMGWDDAEVG